jgi:hypothetical protein
MNGPVGHRPIERLLCKSELLSRNVFVAGVHCFPEPADPSFDARRSRTITISTHTILATSLGCTRSVRHAVPHWKRDFALTNPKILSSLPSTVKPMAGCRAGRKLNSLADNRGIEAESAKQRQSLK